MVEPPVMSTAAASAYFRELSFKYFIRGFSW
jgi:hypothetical protein